MNMNLLPVKMALEHIGLTHKVRHKHRLRRFIQLLWRANLHNIALFHHDNGI
ncbi:Uncharacterised protein [Vibrio cholerae]|uniref:Uncharacterized protein n=1 Tax=Vibrio cholerae TaxID=666 RepID=A0A655QME6_VIBCL|nr:Uncharacterised protein [Vibrio cholerae]